MRKENVNTDLEKYKEYMYTQHFILIGHLIVLFYFQVIEACKFILFLNTLLKFMFDIIFLDIKINIRIRLILSNMLIIS